MGKHELHIEQSLSLRRRVIMTGLLTIGLSLFIIGGAMGISKANDRSVVEGQPRGVGIPGAILLASDTRDFQGNKVFLPNISLSASPSPGTQQQDSNKSSEKLEDKKSTPAGQREVVKQTKTLPQKSQR